MQSETDADETGWGASGLWDDEDEDHGKKVFPHRPRGHKANKADLAREAAALRSP
jgi:hypothetical protein